MRFLFPTNCINCGVGGALLCEQCASLISKNERFRCPFCETTTDGGRPCRTHTDSALTRVLSAGSYRDSVLRRALHTFKYGAASALGARLGDFLAQSALRFRTLLPEKALIVPMPLSPLKNRLRPFNQSLTLAHAVGTACGFEVQPALARRFTFWDILVPSHAHLEHTDPTRWFSLERTFTSQHDNTIKNNDVILIDDVLTSGANLEMAARTLKASGAHSITGLVLARA